MRRISAFILALLTLTVCTGAIPALAEEGAPTVFVSNTGRDSFNGSSPALPVGSLPAAYAALGGGGGNIVIMDEITLGEAVILPEHIGKITMTSVYDGVDYREERGAKLTVNKNLTFNGSTVFRDMNFNTETKNIVLLCNGNTMLFDTGLNGTATGSDATLLGITLGGGDNLERAGGNLTINSGDWYRIRGGNRNTGAVTGDTYITINGGTINNMLEVGGAGTCTGNLYLYVTGGTFLRSVYINSTKELNGNAYGFITGGDFKSSFFITNGGKISGDVVMAVSTGGFSPSVAASANTIGGEKSAYVVLSLASRFTGYDPLEIMTGDEVKKLIDGYLAPMFESLASSDANEAEAAAEKLAKTTVTKGKIYGNNLSVEVVADKEEYKSGDSAVFTITVKNDSETAAKNVSFASSIEGINLAGTSIGSIAAGGSATIQIAAGIDTPAPAAAAKNILLYIGGAAAVVIIAVIFFLTDRNKKKKAAALCLAIMMLPALVTMPTKAEEAIEVKTYPAKTLTSSVSAKTADGFAGYEWQGYGADIKSSDGVLSSAAGHAYIVTTKKTDGNVVISGDARLDKDGEFTVFARALDSYEDGVLTINGYAMTVNSITQTVNVYVIRRGTYYEYGSRDIDFKTGEWYPFKVTAEGAYVRFWFNENPLDAEPYQKFDMLLTDYNSGCAGIYFGDGAASVRSLSVGKFVNDYTGATYRNPIMEATDPDIFYWDGTYYMYCADDKINKGVSCYTSTDLVTWTDAGLALKAGDAYGDLVFKAANVVEYDGWFYMFYMSKPKDGVSRTSYASAKSPLGPFANSSKTKLTDKYEIIGGQPFVDDDGQCYLTLVQIDGGNILWVYKMTLADGVATVDFDSGVKVLSPTEKWENAKAPVTECGYIIKHEGLYYMLYSGGNYNSTYGTGYAVSESPMGPYTKYEHNPILRSNSVSFGVGASSVFVSPDGSEHWIVYIANYSKDEVRPLNVRMDRIKFVDNPNGGADIIEVCGPTATPQPAPSNGENAKTQTQTDRYIW